MLISSIKSRSTKYHIYRQAIQWNNHLHSTSLCYIHTYIHVHVSGRSTGLEPCWTTKADVVERLPVTLIPTANSCKSSYVCPQHQCGNTNSKQTVQKAICPNLGNVSHSPAGKRVCRVSSSASSIVKASVFLTSSREGIPSSWPTSSLSIIHSTGVTFLFSSVGGFKGETYNL